MKRYAFRSLIAAALFLVAAGCNSVTVVKPFGKAATLADAKVLEGRWINDENDVLEVRVMKNGGLALGGTEWDESAEEFHTHSMKASITRCGDKRIVYLHADDLQDPPTYVFCRYEIDGTTVKLYPPSFAAFEQAQQAGQLTGKLHEGQYSKELRLDSPAGAIEKFIRDSPDAFEAESNIKFRRLKRFD